jgi:LDH2 family malate/lactate/ureidoglycolate dehydrogenase
MAASKITIARPELERFIADIFRARGLSGEDARTIAEVLVWANLRGIESHGISRVPRYLQFIDLGDLQPAAQPQIHRFAEALFHLDAAHAAGAVAMQRAVATAVEMVPRAGVCLGIVSHTTHAGAIGLYALRLAERGYAALVIAAGMPNMAYFGTRTASLSTSPIAIAVPGRQYGPLVLDMATAVAAAGRINQARLAGQPLPEGWALAKDGAPTTDPAHADIAMPLGGAKGSGLSFMFECLTGLVPAAPILLRAVGATGPRRNAQNAMLLALDVARFRPLEEFCRDVDALATLMKSQPRRPGVDEVLLPGERSRRTAAVRERDGIPVSARVWQQLGEVAAALKLGLPPVRDA